jgi:hypothetical protein
MDIKPDDIGLEQVILSTHTDSSPDMYTEIVIRTDGFLECRHYQDTVLYAVESEGSISTTQSTNIAFLYNATTTTLELFIDGVLVHYNASVPVFTYNSENVVLGGDATSTFVGKLYGITMYSGCLLASEVESPLLGISSELLLPYGTAYARGVTSRGDCISRDLSLIDAYKVQYKTVDGITSDCHYAYVHDNTLGTTEEVYHLDSSLSSDSQCGEQSFFVRSGAEMLNMLTTNCTQTVMRVGGTSVTMDSEGLQVSDDGALYFGSNKAFRMRYQLLGSIAFFLVEGTDSQTGEYETRFRLANL